MNLANQIIEVERNQKWVIVVLEDLKPGEIFRIKPLEKRMRYTEYLSNTKQVNHDKALAFGLEDNEEFMAGFVYSLDNVLLDMEVDTETGESWILGIKGVKLKEPVKG